MKKILLLALAVTCLGAKLYAQDSTDPSLQNVISAYLDVKNALTKDNGAAVQADAKALYEAINKVPMDKLTEVEHRVWMEYKDKLSSSAEKIKLTQDLKDQRIHFMKLSDNFYKMLKGMNINSTDLYYQFCPMANDGKGAYWVSEQEGILNPYFGKMMLKCGSTKETIKANQ